MKKLAILIPTTPDREPLYNRLLTELNRQIGDNNDKVIILSYLTEKAPTKQEPHLTGPKTGYKRNWLVQEAIKENAYSIAFHDSDDMPGPTYIQRGLEFMESGIDCAELWGQIYWNGKPGKPFHHIIDCVNPKTGKLEWWEDDKFYYRTINHLNFQKLDLVKDIPFPDQVFGEDGVQSERMRDAKIFKTMYHIPEIIYSYFNGNPKHAL
jgi:hypothetical protein